MKKIIILIICVLLIGLLGGCNSIKLADSFDKNTVVASAKQVIDYLNSGEYDNVHAMMRNDLIKVLTTQVLTDNSTQFYDKAGSFVEFKTTNVVGKTEKGMDYAVALIEAKHEKKKILYTISFDSNMQVVGLFMR